MPLQLFIKWEQSPKTAGTFEIRNGKIIGSRALDGLVRFDGGMIEMPEGQEALLELEFEGSPTVYGKDATIIQWRCEERGFAFLTSHLLQEKVIRAPDLGISIAVSRDLLEESAPAKIAFDTEQAQSFETTNWDYWEKRNNPPRVPTVLGVSRDQRLFVVDTEQGEIRASLDLNSITLKYGLGRVGAADLHYERSLEDGYLPILHLSHRLGDVWIEDTFFVTFADRPLTDSFLTGTPFPLSLLGSKLGTFPPGLEEKTRQEMSVFKASPELVLFVRTRLTNKGPLALLVPERLPYAIQNVDSAHPPGLHSHLDSAGVCWAEGIPVSMHEINGVAPASQQPCFLLAPQKSVIIDSMLSHRNEGLSKTTREAPICWEEKLLEVKAFWQSKLARASTVHLPEKRLENFWKAGLIHLDLITFGENKKGPLLAKVGIYSAIGSESIPIIEFFDSVGWTETASRSLDAFFELQHPNGRINLYSHYDVETGGALSLAGYHYAYTQDKNWVRTHSPQLKKAADYLLQLRNLSDPSAPNYGLISGSCADPVDATSAFMLNAFNASGLAAVATMLKSIEHSEWKHYQQNADFYQLCLRRALEKSFAAGPLLPVASDRWVPSCAPWAEGLGPQVLGLKGENCFTHWSYFVFDALLGPLYATYLGILSPRESFTDWLLEINKVHYNRGSVAESQPYYSRHPEIHLAREERDDFLNAFYSGLTSMADREVFTFWEHYHKVSIHKTHEEGWALMQLRRMLWFEVGSELRILSGIPKQWLNPGESIEIKNAHSYFGDFSCRIHRSPDGRSIEIVWDPNLHSSPSEGFVYLPGLKIGAGQGEMEIAERGRIRILEPLRKASATFECLTQ